MFCRFRIFGGILMFFPSRFYITSRFADVSLFTSTYPLAYDTWWMWIPTFWFEKLFDFLCNPFYSNFVWIVGKFMKFFDETFWKCFISGNDMESQLKLTFWNVWCPMDRKFSFISVYFGCNLIIFINNLCVKEPLRHCFNGILDIGMVVI